MYDYIILLLFQFCYMRMRYVCQQGLKNNSKHENEIPLKIKRCLWKTKYVMIMNHWGWRWREITTKNH